MGGPDGRVACSGGEVVCQSYDLRFAGAAAVEQDYERSRGIVGGVPLDKGIRELVHASAPVSSSVVVNSAMLVRA